MAPTYQFSFGRPIAIFPLPSVSLLPHLMQRVHIFEPRYRQMVEHVMAAGGGATDQAEPIAMAVVDPEASSDGQMQIRDAVCVGRIVDVQRYPDGRFNLSLHGVCRAQIEELDQPEGDRLYLRGWLRPIDADLNEFPPMPEVRRTVRGLLRNPRLRRLRDAQIVRDIVSRDDVPTTVALDLIGFQVLQDESIRYDLLSEPDCRIRAERVTRELQSLDRLISMVDRQHPDDWPKGLSWN